jgi:DNA-binding transcriptional ArsR family regulator
MRSPLRQNILLRYAETVTSPSDVAAALGEPLNLVSYHTRVLLQAGCIELVGTEPRRGATKHFYRSDLLSEIDDDVWVQLPVRMRRALVRGTMVESWREAGDALPDGGMDDAEAHVSRHVFELDQRGREDLAELLRTTVERAWEIQASSRHRAAGDTSRRQLVIMSFEPVSPP